MSQFILTVVADASFAGGNNPSLQVLIGGSPVSAQFISASSNTYTFFLNYSGSYPSSLALQFDPGSGDPGDTINISEVRINGQDITSDLTATILAQGASGSYNTAAGDYLFGRVEATNGDLGSATHSGSGNVNGGENADVINASAAADRVRGLGGDDAIDGGDGNDIIFGEGGNDLIIGQGGNDTIFGGTGDDLIYGGADNDTLIGEAGNDVLNGGAGSDGLLGDAGNDILYGEGGDDWLIGGAGDDYLFGDDGNDTLIGGTGSDVMLGGNNNDQMHGDSGDDEMYGEAGQDLMTGGIGVDTMFGGADNDEMYGNDGDDQMDGGTGDDYLNGGDGADTIDGDDDDDTIIGGAGADIIDGGNGNDIIHGHGLDEYAISTILAGNPNVIYSQVTGSFYQFVASGATWTASQTAASATTLSGVNGHLATVTSLEEVAFLDAQVNPTNDTSIGSYFTSGSDADVADEWVFTDGVEQGVQFWQGQDAGSTVNNIDDMWVAGQPNSSAQNYVYLLSYSDGMADSDNNGFAHSEGYIVEWESGLFSDDNAADILSGGAGNDWIYGWGGDDTLNGDAGNDFLFGQDGDDTMDGGNNDDLIVGASGSDTILGGSGNDVIYAAIVGTVGAQTVVDAGGGGGSVTWTFVDEDFTGSTGVFTYSDFNDPGNVDVTGSYQGSDGNTANGSAQIDVDNTGGSFADAAGYYQTTFVSNDAGTNTQITFSYRHTHTNQNDNGEDSSVFLVFNGTLYDQFGGNGWINTALGSGGATDTGWVTVTVNLPDLVDGATNTVWLGLYHSDSNSNPEDARVRFDDVTVTSELATVTLIDEDFASNSGVFSYADDLFGGTDSNNYADGTWINTDGSSANGALETTLGYNGGGGQTNYSGGWSTTVNLSQDLDNITLEFDYRLLRGDGFENNEDAYVYVEIDNVRYGIAPNDYIEWHEGDGNGGAGAYDSGWTAVTLDIGTLTAGNHTVEIGVFHEGSTVNGDEDTVLRLDDIIMSAASGSGGNDATSSGNDSTATNYLDGGDGNDVLYGSAGNDYLYGGSGSDELYSDSSQTYTVADALAEIGGLQYNADTGSFYLYVSGAVTAPTAFTNAAAQALNGVSGHIVHITSAAENAYIDTLTGTATIWLGMNDTAVEGEWRLIGGPNDGDLFWLGDSSGSLQSGYTYENFNGGEPNDWNTGEDYMEMQNGGGWNDNGGPQNPSLTHGYVVEWEASEVFSFGATIMNGGSGADDLYGSAGADLFVFDYNGGDAFTNPDTVFNFDMNDGDALDISDILDGLGVNSGNLSSFVDISEANGLRIDTSGSGSFGGNEVATFSGFSAVSDEATMLANGNLIIY